MGALGYGWGSGKSGIWIKAFLYIKFFKKESLGQQIPKKIPTWPCIADVGPTLGQRCNVIWGVSRTCAKEGGC